MKRPRWNAGAASWRLHRAHTAKPLMSIDLFQAVQRITKTLLKRHDLLLWHIYIASSTVSCAWI